VKRVTENQIWKATTMMCMNNCEPHLIEAHDDLVRELAADRDRLLEALGAVARLAPTHWVKCEDGCDADEIMDYARAAIKGGAK
jgi:hypothetical protein